MQSRLDLPRSEEVSFELYLLRVPSLSQDLLPKVFSFKLVTYIKISRSDMAVAKCVRVAILAELYLHDLPLSKSTVGSSSNPKLLTLYDERSYILNMVSTAVSVSFTMEQSNEAADTERKDLHGKRETCHIR